MAIVRTRSNGTQTTDPAEITSMLADMGIVYEQWNIDKLESSDAPKSATPQEHILNVFADEIAEISESRGYSAADVIALKPDMPNLEEVLAKFDKEHLHTEDEVRFVVSGRGVFVIRADDGELYDVEVHPGDLLAVPDGTKHWFELCEDRQIQCIRLFTDPTGWVAHYVDGAK